MIRIEASILSADYTILGEQAREAQEAGVDGLQIDVMDGRFVPDITFGPGIVRALRCEVNIKLDVHLMIVEPERHLAAFAETGADRLIVHQETCPHPANHSGVGRRGRRHAQPRHTARRYRGSARPGRCGAGNDRQPRLGRAVLPA
jgi:ribulose-phosphate 3-epimerase